MPKYLLRRFAEMLITLFLIATATFFLLEAVPGDPLTERASKLSPTVKENLYKRYGLDKPMMERYVITMKGICKGEFGESVVYAGQTVQKLIHDRLPVSARLGIQQVLVGITIGLLLGILAAMRRGSFWDYMVIALSVRLDFHSEPDLWSDASENFRRQPEGSADDRLACGKGSVVRRMGIHDSSDPDRMLFLYRNVCASAENLDARCDQSGLRADC